MAQPVTAVSNLAESSNGDAGPFRGTFGGSFGGTSIYNYAFSFTTGTTHLNLAGVTLASPYTDSAAGLSLSLYSNNAGAPQTSLGTFGAGQSAGTMTANSTYASNFQLTSFTPTTQTIALSASTTYWLLAYFTSDGQFRMPTTTSTSETAGLTGWSIGDTYLDNQNGGGWNTISRAIEFSVSAADAPAVPEPATYAVVLATAMLGFTIWRRRHPAR